MVADKTTISEFPKQLVKYFTCKLLHDKVGTWDGTYYYDEENCQFIPNIKYKCKICDKDGEN